LIKSQAEFDAITPSHSNDYLELNEENFPIEVMSKDALNQWWLDDQDLEETELT
jgi:hypothetical protein